MKILYVISALLLCPLWMFLSGLVPATSAGAYEPVAVVELFSSQGCSSCPPADRLLSKTISEAGRTKKKIYALSFHVDYWNRLGWKDPFSSSKFSERQDNYTGKLGLNSNYTPQMIVNGTTELLGSDAKALDKAISNALALRSEASFKTLELSFDEKNNAGVHYELQGNYKGCTINFALLSAKETTSIKRGENSGITLINEHVVNQLITRDALEKGEVIFAPAPAPLKNNTLIIAFIQNAATLKIMGAAEVKPGNLINQNQ